MSQSTKNTQLGSALTEDGQKLATQTIENMKNRYGYTEESANEVVTFLMRSRYHQ